MNMQTHTQMYLQMCRIRAFEEAAVRALEAGDVPGPIHPSIGQEAIAVGVCGRMRREDILLSTHRGHGHTLVKGASPKAMMRELLGKADGCCAGKGGSMHIADFDVGMLGANGVVGANILIAAGAAHAMKLKRENRITVCIFGDGAVNRGPFLEGLNWAATYALPILFVCEDNGFAATTRTESLTAGPGPGARAESLGISAAAVDGNDLLAVDDIAAELIESIRQGVGPRFLHARTYRLTGHTAADPATYRSPDEVAQRWHEDPIVRSARSLTRSGLDSSEIEAMKSQADDEMAQALDAARAAPQPQAPLAFTDVQDLRGPEHAAV